MRRAKLGDIRRARGAGGGLETGLIRQQVNAERPDKERAEAFALAEVAPDLRGVHGLDAAEVAETTPVVAHDQAHHEQSQGAHLDVPRACALLELVDECLN